MPPEEKFAWYSGFGTSGGRLYGRCRSTAIGVSFTTPSVGSSWSDRRGLCRRDHMGCNMVARVRNQCQRFQSCVCLCGVELY